MPPIWIRLREWWHLRFGPPTPPYLMLQNSEIDAIRKEANNYVKPMSVITKRDVFALIAEVEWARAKYNYPVPKTRR